MQFYRFDLVKINTESRDKPLLLVSRMFSPDEFMDFRGNKGVIVAQALDEMVTAIEEDNS